MGTQPLGAAPEEGASEPRSFIGYPSALAIVVANMVGTGVFTTLGLQAEGVADGFALLILWALGGLVALCGALCYAELAAALPRSGGEYHFLSRIYHPLLGSLAGWVSVIVGFAAPVGLTAMALGAYTATLWPIAPEPVAVLGVLGVGLFHLVDLRLGRWFHNATTLLKVLVLVALCVLGLGAPAVPGALSLTPSVSSLEALLTPAFGVALIYVSYAYSGWNAATYLINEVERSRQTVPRALIHGTLLVTLAYLVLNAVFLRTLPLAELAGSIEVGALSAHHLFGSQGGRIMTLALCLLLLSSLSALILIGPRVLQVIGEDVAALHFLATRNRRGIPVRALLFQQALALAFIATDSFEGVLTYAGFTLSLSTLLTVLGVMVLRWHAPELPRPFRAPLYPLPPLVFAALTGVGLAFVLWERPWAAAGSLLTLLIGGLLGFGRHRGGARGER